MLDQPQIKTQCERFIKAVEQFHKALGPIGKGDWIIHQKNSELVLAGGQVCLIMQELQTILSLVCERSKSIENCWHRVQKLLQQFILMLEPGDEEAISWYETQEHNFGIHRTPLHIGDSFQELIGSQKAWIFTSATISVKGDFSYFKNCLGLKNSKELYLQSPFNFNKQALMYRPTCLPLPKDHQYIVQLVEQALPLIRLMQGRTFFLFTSHKALQEAALILKPKITFPLLIQGEASKSQLLSLFSSLGNAVLLGTHSFWEGVDVKGDTLHCVIIDKIPFASPEDPLLKAKVKYFQRLGKNPFREYQLPQAVIALRQGIGRLIRDITDRGVLMLADPRFVTQDYGKWLLNSLPNMPITSSLNDVATFLENTNDVTFAGDI